MLSFVQGVKLFTNSVKPAEETQGSDLFPTICFVKLGMSSAGVSWFHSELKEKLTFNFYISYQKSSRGRHAQTGFFSKNCLLPFLPAASAHHIEISYFFFLFSTGSHSCVCAHRIERSLSFLVCVCGGGGCHGKEAVPWLCWMNCEDSFI